MVVLAAFKACSFGELPHLSVKPYNKYGSPGRFPRRMRIEVVDF
jgi:hypothetical protein